MEQYAKINKGVLVALEKEEAGCSNDNIFDHLKG